MSVNGMSMNIASFTPSFTQQLIGNILTGSFAQQAMTSSSFLNGTSGLNSLQFSKNSKNPFSLDSASLYNINPMAAVAIATSIGGLPPQIKSQPSGGQLLGPQILNNIDPINAVGLAIQLAGPLLSRGQASLIA
jgi:hypothetical protein